MVKTYLLSISTCTCILGLEQSFSHWDIKAHCQDLYPAHGHDIICSLSRSYIVLGYENCLVYAFAPSRTTHSKQTNQEVLYIWAISKC